MESSQTRDPTHVPCFGRWILNYCTTREILEQFLKLATYSMRQVHAKLLQLFPTLCDPMDCSLLGSSVHGIIQARILEWVAMPSSRGSSGPRDWSYISCAGRFFTATSPFYEILSFVKYHCGFSAEDKLEGR